MITGRFLVFVFLLPFFVYAVGIPYSTLVFAFLREREREVECALVVLPGSIDL